MLSLFNSTPKAVALVTKSGNIISVFTKTMQELQSVNDEITNEHLNIGDAVAEAQRKHDAFIAEQTALQAQLTTTLLTNSNVITNIEKILS